MARPICQRGNTNRSKRSAFVFDEQIGMNILPKVIVCINPTSNFFQKHILHRKTIKLTSRQHTGLLSLQKVQRFVAKATVRCCCHLPSNIVFSTSQVAANHNTLSYLLVNPRSSCDAHMIHLPFFLSFISAECSCHIFAPSKYLRK